MQAITTHYLPATARLGARIIATCERGSASIPYPHELTGSAVHCRAADELCRRFVDEDAKEHGQDPKGNPWAGRRVCGDLPGGGCAHVFVS
jgi:hypothetical protein